MPIITKKGVLTKRLMVEKTNELIVYITAAASFLIIFSLVASKTLINQAGYQNRIISAKKTAKHQLDTNLVEAGKLSNFYSSFINTPQNIIGGNPNGQAQNDGNNAKIILDALPSKYDFPALVAQLQAIVSSNGVTLTAITGTDDEIAQQNIKNADSSNAVPIPFQVDVHGNSVAVLGLIDAFQRSIRPFQFQTIQLDSKSGQNDLTLTIMAQTYFQPHKSFKLNSRTIK